MTNKYIMESPHIFSLHTTIKIINIDMFLDNNLYIVHIVEVEII